MVRREPPQTEEGWYALHDLRTIDWAAWRDAPQRVRERAVAEATHLLASATDVEDAAEGDSALYAVTGHKADLMVVHLRPSHAAVEHLERRFEQTELARFTERTYSYVSVTEMSGYSERAREYFEGDLEEDSGLAQYLQSRLHPEIPDHEHVSFYPMSKRRDPEYNWYDLPFEERAEHMDSHGDIGRDYAGKVQQMITGSVGMDDWEWGVTLWADDLTDVKDLLYEMRFDPSTSKFAEFGPFYLGRRFPPADLGTYLAGGVVPTGEGDAAPTGQTPLPEAETPAAGTAERVQPADGDGTQAASHGDGADAGAGEAAEESGDDQVDVDDAGGSDGRPDPGEADAEHVDDIGRHMARFGLMPSDYEDGQHVLVFYADGDAEDLVDEVSGLRENFDHYDTHVMTSVRADKGQAAIVSIWENDRAASTAAGFLSDIDAVSRQIRGVVGDGEAVDAGEDTDEVDTDAEIRDTLADNEVYAGKPHGEEVYALVVYSEADPETLAEEVDDLRAGFDRYDTHVKTALYETAPERTAGDGDTLDSTDVAAVVTLWDTQDAAETASEYLSGLPGIVGRPEDRDGFGTMGMFYTVKPDYREEFVDTFGVVGEKLTGMDGHRETALLVNREDDTDMFIASRWDAKENALTFFRSDEFRDTVEWGREVLADRPRHVFLA